MKNSIRVTKRDCWQITANVQTKFKVFFNEAVTPDEAKDLFMNGEFQEIHDEEVLQIGFVTSVGI